MVEVREYIDTLGKNLYRDWLVSLDAATRARIIAAVLRMESGNFSAAKSVGSGVSEMRLDFGPGYRVYFGMDGDELVILLVVDPRGGSKQTSRPLIGLGRSTSEGNQSKKMALTRSFRETIKEQLADREFRREFLREAVANMVAGDLDTAKSVLREYINGTLGFIALGKALSKSPKSLMRMLSPEGNPHARNLFEMISYLQRVEGAVLQVSVASAA